MGDPDIFMGWQAFYVSFAAIPDVFHELRASPWNISRDIEWTFAYLAGAAANTAFLAGFLSHLFAARLSKAGAFAHRPAVLAIALTIVNLTLMVFSLELGTIYPGFGFWAASFLALALGTRP
jgi:hypothetical protein